MTTPAAGPVVLRAAGVVRPARPVVQQHTVAALANRGDSVHDLKEIDRLKLVDRAWADAAAKWQQENKSTDDFGSRKRRSLENWRRTREG